MLDTRELSNLIGSIYDCILQPAEWQLVLETVCRVLDTRAASVHIVNPIAQTTRFLAEHGGDAAYNALAMTKYATMNPVGAAILVGEIDQALGLFDLIDEEELVETRWYKEWCIPQNYHDMMGAVIVKRPTEIGALSSVRGVDQPRFGAAERAFFTLIAPHVRRAATISALLDQRTLERENFAAVIDRLSTAVVLADRNGGIVKANPAAEALAQSGSILRLKQQVLGFLDERADRLVRAAFASPSEEPRFVPIERSGGGQLVAAILTIDSRAGLHAVFIHPQEPDMPPFAKHLQLLFKLTPREVCVLLPLLAGKDIAEIADELGIARTTAKTHLDRLFLKTGTNRQVDLVTRVMQASPPVRLG